MDSIVQLFINQLKLFDVHSNRLKWLLKVLLALVGIIEAKSFDWNTYMIASWEIVATISLLVPRLSVR